MTMMMMMRRALQWLGDNLIITKKKNTIAMMVKSSKAVTIKYSAGDCS